MMMHYIATKHHAGVYRLFLLAWILMPVTAWSEATIADMDVTAQVESEFILDPVIPFNTIDVMTVKGIVTLTGKVNHLIARERATRIAETVRGVRAVINRIEVEPLVDQSGEALAESVQDALLYDAATDSYEISVLADDKGSVTLAGTVDSRAEQQLAETVAKGVNGVTAVNNTISVEPKSQRPDEEIRPEIEKRLRWDALVDDALIHVDVENGKVRLSGVAGSAAEKRRAQLDAWVAGVKAVDSSSLNVEKWARDEALRQHKYVVKSDAVIRKALQDALLYDPRVYRFNVEIRVVNGYVTLHGVVDNLQAKQAAERDALNTVGVSRVRNLVKVRPTVRVDDEVIADKVHTALQRSPLLESSTIDVRVNNGVVHLDGSIDSYFAKAEAENVAYRARGATQVRNHLSVAYPEPLVYDPYVYDWSIDDYPWYGIIAATGKSDREIRQDIETELFWSPFVVSGNINVSVESGIATLTGSVGSLQEYKAVRQKAFEGGATAIISKLNVRL